MLARSAQIRPPRRSIQKYMKYGIALITITIGLSFAASVRADDNVREVQTKLSDQGFYFGQIDGAYSSDLGAALSRYQIRNGLPITGQLDVETSKALGAKPAVGLNTAATEQSSETWRRLRKGERRTSAKMRETSSPRTDKTGGSSTETQPQSAPPATAQISPETIEPASAPPATTSADEFNTERLRDYVAAFVLAGLDKNVGVETEFFADRVAYYDSGRMDREKIREDLRRYDERWPERHFWVAGPINIEPQSETRVRVTFPLGFKLRNGNKNSSGKVNKTLILEAAGDDLEIVAVNEVSER
jgi:peptidoglycan hydrolase-like protein with peptidoglycan-binding domain